MHSVKRKASIGDSHPRNECTTRQRFSNRRECTARERIAKRGAPTAWKPELQPPTSWRPEPQPPASLCTWERGLRGRCWRQARKEPSKTSGSQAGVSAGRPRKIPLARIFHSQVRRCIAGPRGAGNASEEGSSAHFGHFRALRADHPLPPRSVAPGTALIRAQAELSALRTLLKSSW